VSPRPPRYRYVAFWIEGSSSFRRDDVVDALRACLGRASLVEFHATKGLVRCTNFEKDETIRALVSIDRVAGQAVRVTTLGTSGTIRRATEKYLR